MDQESSIRRIVWDAFDKHETLNDDLDLLVALNRSARIEEEHVKIRREILAAIFNEFFAVTAEAWQCSMEEAMDACGKIYTVERFLVQGRDAIALLPYQDYLKSAHWRGIRHYALLRADYRCQLCNSTQRLEVHHRTYEGKGNEDYRDVIALCHECHAKFHGKA